jgi:hypothetical protein
MPNQKLLAEIGNVQPRAGESRCVAAEGLQPTSTDTVVRFSGDKRTVIDSLFAGTKELIGGFWLGQVRSKEEAIDWVKRSPNLHNDETEIGIRRLFEAEHFGAKFMPALSDQETHPHNSAAHEGENTCYDRASLGRPGNRLNVFEGDYRRSNDDDNHDQRKRSSSHRVGGSRPLVRDP